MSIHTCKARSILCRPTSVQVPGFPGVAQGLASAFQAMCNTTGLTLGEGGVHLTWPHTCAKLCTYTPGVAALLIVWTVWDV
jgi:hypothetical protein